MSPYQRQQLEREIRFTTSRSGGPGGQHVNKTETRVSLFWNVWASEVFTVLEKQRLVKQLSNRVSSEGELAVHSEQTRSQVQNKEAALKLFYNLVEKALIPPKVRRATKPTRASIEKRIEFKKRKAATKKLRRKGGWERE